MQSLESQVDNVAVSLGYIQYCSTYDCDIPACSATVKLNGHVFHKIDFHDELQLQYELQVRNVYKDDVDENFLFYMESEHAWMVSPQFDAQQAIMKTSSCPQQGGTFMNTTEDLPPIPGIVGWRECSSICLDRSTCNFWQYNSTGYI